MERTKTHLLLLALALFALGVSFEIGRRGFMPLDQSVVFDGGWRILSGQVPWRDFDSPSFVTPSAIQALFFKAFGVNWWSYLLHAMVANVVFAMLVFGFARRLNLGRMSAAALAAGSAVVFSPPIGTPFADQEAFLFTFAAIVCAWSARVAPLDSSPWRVRLIWAFVPVMLTLGFFSKQLPSALAPLVVGLILIAPADRSRREGAGALLGGVMLTSALLVALFTSFGIDPGRVIFDLFVQPLQEANLRQSYLPKRPLGLMVRLVYIGTGQGMLVVCFIHLGSFFVVLRELTVSRWRGLRSLAFWSVVFGEVLLFTNAVTLVLSNNQDGGGVAWFFVAAAPVLAGLHLTLGQARNRVVLTRGITLILIAIVASDAGRFHQRMNKPRVANDMIFSIDSALPADVEVAALAPMLWEVPKHHTYPLTDFSRLVREIKSRDGDMFLVGDSAVLYGLVGSRSTSPALWFHPGVSLPRPGTQAFVRWQTPLVEAIERGEIARIVEERAGTWIGNLTLADFQRVQKAAQKRGFVDQDFGAFRVLELRPIKD